MHCGELKVAWKCDYIRKNVALFEEYIVPAINNDLVRFGVQCLVVDVSWMGMFIASEAKYAARLCWQVQNTC